VFAVQVIAGKQINADELKLYRESNESSFTHWRRRAVNIAIGGVGSRHSFDDYFGGACCSKVKHGIPVHVLPCWRVCKPTVIAKSQQFASCCKTNRLKLSKHVPNAPTEISAN
jgi:hypothetical protein